jgi:hypothetical protein
MCGVKVIVNGIFVVVENNCQAYILWFFMPLGLKNFK